MTDLSTHRAAIEFSATGSKHGVKGDKEGVKLSLLKMFPKMTFSIDPYTDTYGVGRCMVRRLK